MESGDGGRGGGGVTWHGMFLRVPQRRVFGVVAAFTLMMQFHRLPASRRQRAFLCHRRPGPYQTVTVVRHGPPSPA